jgi:multiple sugar transport system permease protein
MESKNNWKAWLYLAPALILLSVFTFFPIINTVIVSFTKDYDVIDASFSGFTFDNYIDILTPINNANGNDGTAFESVMLIGLPNTLLLTFITVPISIILSLIIAICLNSIKFFKKIFQTIFFMPYVTNAIAIGMVFSVIFDTKYGLMNFLFGTPGFPWIYQNLTTGATVNYWSALFAICFYIIWHSLPYKMM